MSGGAKSLIQTLRSKPLLAVFIGLALATAGAVTVDGDGVGTGGTGRGGIGNGWAWYWTPAVSGVRAARYFHTAKPTPATAPASAPRRTILITRPGSHGDPPHPERLAS